METCWRRALHAVSRGKATPYGVLSHAGRARSGRRISCAYSPELRGGGAYRDRTDDPLLAKQVLSQLS